MGLDLGFEESTATEPDQERARVPAACGAQVYADDDWLGSAEYDFMDDGDDEDLNWYCCESFPVSGSNTPPWLGYSTRDSVRRRSLSSPSARAPASVCIKAWTCC